MRSSPFVIATKAFEKQIGIAPDFFRRARSTTSECANASCDGERRARQCDKAIRKKDKQSVIARSTPATVAIYLFSSLFSLIIARIKKAFENKSGLRRIFFEEREAQRANVRTHLEMVSAERGSATKLFGKKTSNLSLRGVRQRPWQSPLKSYY